MLGRSDARAVLERVATVTNTASDAADFARGARALRALGRFEEANAAFLDATQAAPRDPAIETAWGELFLEAFNRNEALKSFQTALRVDSKYVPALLGIGAGALRRRSSAGQAIAKMALEINPSSVPAHVFLAGEAADAGKRDEARKSLQKALEVNPSSLEAHALLAGLAYVEDKTPEFEAEVAQGARDRAELRRGVSRRRRAGGAQLPLRRGGDAGAEGARARSEQRRAPADLGMHLLRTGDEAGPASALERSFKPNGYDQVTYNLLQMLDTLDKFVTVRDGDLMLRIDKDEAPVLQEHAMSLAHEALNTLSQALRVHAEGADPDRDLSRSTTTSRCAPSACPGMIGALGACFGRVVTMDSPQARPPGEFQWEATLWHELAHVDHAADVEPARAALADRRHFGVRGEARTAPEWGREMDMTFAGCSTAARR